MITDEIGVKNMFREVFNINSEQELISNNNFETFNLEHVKVKNTAYIRMSEYLKKNNRFSMDVFLAINTTLAYGHHPSELDAEIEKYINKHIDIFIKELESIKDLNSYLNNEALQAYERVFANKISYDLIKNVTTLSLYHSRLYEDIHFYGVQNLLLNLSKYSHEKFSKWFITTSRNDLKVIYTEAISSFMNSIDCLSESNINSGIPFIRTFAKILFYNLDRNLQLPNISKYFYDLDSNEENIYFVLYYFSNKRFDLKNQNSINELNDDIKKASKYLNYLNQDILREFLRDINKSVVYCLIDEIKNHEIEIKLFKVLFEDLKIKIEFEQFISNFSIENANMLGNVLLVLDESSLNEVLSSFDELVKKMEEPYYVYKFHNQWDKQISILIHFLIAVFIYFQAMDNKKYLQYKKRFLKVKKSFVHVNDKYIEDILKQIM